MKSGGKWPAGRWLAPTKATAESEPMAHRYIGHEFDDSDQPQLPPAVPFTAQEAVPTAVRPAHPMPTASTVPPQTAAPAAPLAMAQVTPPAIAAAPSAGLRPAAPRHSDTRQRDRMRAVIGDGLRIPTLLCEFSGCMARYTHREALGERDLRDWALAAGWQYDLIGRLACPTCVRHAPTFWAAAQTRWPSGQSS